MTINFCIIVLTLRNSPDLEALLGAELGVQRGPVGGEDSGVGAVKMNISSGDVLSRHN